MPFFGDGYGYYHDLSDSVIVENDLNRLDQRPQPGNTQKVEVSVNEGEKRNAHNTGVIQVNTISAKGLYRLDHSEAGR